MKNIFTHKSMMGFIKNISIQTLTMISYLLPILLILIWVFFVENILNYQVVPTYGYIVVIFSVFIAGTSGLFQIIKKEAPWIMGKTIKGKFAVISGVALMILFWGGGIYCTYLLILMLIE